VVRDDQPDAREGQAGRRGVTERFVVPSKPGNAGGGKGPQFKTDATRDEGPGDWATYQLRTVSRNCRRRCIASNCWHFRGAVRLLGQMWGQSDGAELHARLFGNARRSQIPSIAAGPYGPQIPASSWTPHPAHIFGSIEVEGVAQLAKHTHQSTLSSVNISWAGTAAAPRPGRRN
jgi:hypothetical protein